jgi:hypothetical protein
LPSAWSSFRVGTALDADGDGRLDVALAGQGLMLARNVAVAGGSVVWLRLERRGREPVGAFVRARYRDGSVQAWRFGSHNRGHLAQGGGPLPLTTSSENPLDEIEVCFPGGESRRVGVSAPGTLNLSVD